MTTTRVETLIASTASATDLRGVSEFLVEDSGTVVFTAPATGQVDVYSVNLDGTYTLLGTCDSTSPARHVEGPIKLTVDKSASDPSAVELWTI